MNDVNIIDALGGGTAVAAALRETCPNRRALSPHAIYMWKRRGIPPAWRYPVAQIAKGKIKGFDHDAFMRAA